MFNKILVYIIIFSLSASFYGCISNEKNLFVGRWINNDSELGVDDVLAFTSDGQYEVYDSINSDSPKFECKYELLEGPSNLSHPF